MNLSIRDPFHFRETTGCAHPDQERGDCAKQITGELHDATTALERDRNLESLHCSDWTRVLRHHRVGGQQRNPLDSRLCH